MPSARGRLAEVSPYLFSSDISNIFQNILSSTDDDERTREASLQNSPVAGFVTLMVENIFLFWEGQEDCLHDFLTQNPTPVFTFMPLSIFLLDIVLWMMVKVVFPLNQTAPQQSALSFIYKYNIPQLFK